MKLTNKKTYTFKYKEINCEIVFWTNENMQQTEHKDLYKSGGIWNSYFTILKKDVSASVFKKFNLRVSTDKYGRKNVNYYQLERNNLVSMDYGITFYDKLYDMGGNLFGIKIGNDYNHIWNTGCENEETIRRDLENTIDNLVI